MPARLYVFSFVLFFSSLLSCTVNEENNIGPDGDDSMVVDGDKGDSDGDAEDDIVSDGDSSLDGDLSTDTDNDPEENHFPLIVLDPAMLDFGSSFLGEDNPKYFLAKNVGKAPARVIDIRFDEMDGAPGNGVGAFTMELAEDYTPPLWIEARHSIAVNLNFKALEGVHSIPSDISGKVCIDWIDENQTEINTCIDLLGSVIEPRPACIAVQPQEGIPGSNGLSETAGPGLDFGYSPVDVKTIQEIEFCNCGDLPLELNNFMWNELFTGPPMAYRAYAEEPGSFRSYSLERGQCISIPISYYPTVEDMKNTAVFQLKTNAVTFEWLDGPQPPDTPEEWAGIVLVGCSGIGARHGIEAFPNELHFSLTELECCSRIQELSIYNSGELPLEITEIFIGAESDESFELLNLPSPDEFPIILGGEGNLQRLRFKVRFCSTYEGEHNGRVEIKSSDGGEFFVPLYGEGALLTHQRDVFEQSTHPVADILWVIDCSGSMSEEQQKIKDQTDTFIHEAVDWNADLHLAVISCDVTSHGSHKGQMQGNPTVLDNAMMSNDNIISKFNDRVGFPGGCDSTAKEAGLEAAHLALSEPLISNENSGFLRDWAKLAIIFLSDENDQSVPEIPFYMDFFRSIKGMRNVNALDVYAIVGDHPGGCSAGDDGDAAAGPRYIRVADTCNVHDDQHFHSICSQDYQAVFDHLVENLFALVHQFYLSRPAVAASITVTVNGSVNNDWAYEEISNSLIFDPSDAPGPGADMVVEYDTLCLP